MRRLGGAGQMESTVREGQQGYIRVGDRALCRASKATSNTRCLRRTTTPVASMPCRQKCSIPPASTAAPISTNDTTSKPCSSSKGTASPRGSGLVAVWSPVNRWDTYRASGPGAQCATARCLRNTLQGPGYASFDLKWTRGFPADCKAGTTTPRRGQSVCRRSDRLQSRRLRELIGTLSRAFGRPIASQPPRRCTDSPRRVSFFGFARTTLRPFIDTARR